MLYVTRRARRRLSLALGATILVLASACGASPPGPVGPPPPPTVDVWMAGDSLASGTANFMVPRPYNAAKGAAGFTEFSVTKILDNTQELIDLHGKPRVLMVMGGINDTNRRLSLDTVTEGIVELNDAMEAQDIQVVWVLEPAWQRAPEMDPINDWLIAHYDPIDCRSSAGAVGPDQIHPVSYRNMSACIYSQLVERGIEIV